MPETLAAVRRKVETFLEDRTGVDLTLTATCLLLAVDRYSRGIAVLFALAALFYRPLQRSALFWFLAAAGLGWSTYQGWPLLDNHRYLINYWILALGFCFVAPDPDRAIATSGRVFIGLTFLLALVQKFLSPDYLDGTYFHFQMLKDSSFTALVESIGGLSPEVQQRNYQALAGLQAHDAQAAPVQLTTSPSLQPLASALTWWTLGIEAVIAITFLSPWPRWVSRFRDP